MTPAEISAEIEAHFRSMLENEDRLLDPLTGQEYLYVRLAEVTQPQAWEERRGIRQQLLDAHHLGLVGNWPAAEEHLREVRETMPDSVSVALALADTLWAQGDVDGALALMRETTLDNPESVRAHAQLGLRLQEFGRPAEAVIPLRRALDLQPGNRAIQQALGMALLETGQEREALEVLEDLANTDPGNLYAILLLANAAERMGEFDLAIDSYERLLTARPEVMSAHQALAELHVRQSDIDAAREAYKRALAIMPESPEINASLHRTMRGRGGQQSVLELWGELADENPRNLDINMARVRRLVNADEDAQAQEALLDLVENLPDNPEPRRLLGSYLLAQGDTEAALEQLRAALALDPNDEDTVDTLIATLLDGGRMDEARELIDQTGDASRRAFNHSRLAQALEDAGEIDAARTEHRTAITLAPDEPAVRLDHLNFLVRQGDNEAGLTAALEAIDRLGLNPRVAGQPVPLYYMVNRFEEAITEGNADEVRQVLEGAVEREPTGGALRSLALFHHDWGDPERARALLDQAWEQDEHPISRLRVIRVHLSQGDVEIAGERLAALREQGLDSVELLLWEGIQRWLAGDLPGAHERWAEALQRDRSFDIVADVEQSIAAEGWDEMGLDLALQTIETLGIFHTTPDGREVNVYGLAARHQEQIDSDRGRVEQVLLSVIGEDPEPEELGMLAQFYAEEGRDAEARDLFLRAAADRTDDEEWTLLISALAAQAEFLDVSEQILRAAMEEAAEPSGTLLVTLGEVLAERGETEEATAAFRDALEQSGDDLDWVIAIAEITRDVELHDLSEEILRDAIRENADNDALHYQLGYTYDEADRTRDAERAFRRSIELNPENYFALNHLGYMFTEENINLEEALDLTERAVALSDHAEDLRGGNAFIVDSLGWAHHRLGNHDEAIRWLREAIRRAERHGVPDGVFQEHLGDALEAAGRTEEALEAWEEAIDLFQRRDEFESVVNVGAKILAVDPDDEDVIEAVTAARAEIAPPPTIP